MKILWVTNVATPEIAEDMNKRSNYSGGWLIQLSKQLAANHELTIAFRYKGEKRTGSINGIHYYTIPFITNEEELNSPENNEYISRILSEISPDLIHIWGTEYLHSSLVFNCAKKNGLADKVIISIQGLVSVYSKYYWAYIKNPIIKIPTLYDVKKKRGIRREYNDFLYRAKYEKQLISEANHFIGRTSWDKASVLEINSGANYYYCNETMRPSFYENEWNYDCCEKDSLFISQGTYPIKGLHIALKALETVKKTKPNIRLYVAGRKPINYSMHARLRETRYTRYLRHLIDKYHVKENVIFVGPLKETEMCEQFLKCNLFLSPSSIENSSNSIAEAMLLGVPVIASDAGGTRDFVHHMETGIMYQTPDHETLANYICDLLSSPDLQNTFSENEKKLAKKLFSAENNYATLEGIYNSIAALSNQEV